MEIQDRLFSENEPEEVYYSVTMTEDEYSLYSEFQKEFGITQKIKSIAKKILKRLTPGRKNKLKEAKKAKSEIERDIELSSVPKILSERHKKAKELIEKHNQRTNLVKKARGGDLESATKVLEDYEYLPKNHWESVSKENYKKSKNLLGLNHPEKNEMTSLGIHYPTRDYVDRLGMSESEARDLLIRTNSRMTPSVDEIGHSYFNKDMPNKNREALDEWNRLNTSLKKKKKFLKKAMN